MSFSLFVRAPLNQKMIHAGSDGRDFPDAHVCRRRYTHTLLVRPCCKRAWSRWCSVGRIWRDCRLRWWARSWYCSNFTAAADVWSIKLTRAFELVDYCAGFWRRHVQHVAEPLHRDNTFVLLVWQQRIQFVQPFQINSGNLVKFEMS